MKKKSKGKTKKDQWRALDKLTQYLYDNALVGIEIYRSLYDPTGENDRREFWSRFLYVHVN